MANDTKTTESQPDNYAEMKAKAVAERKKKSKALAPVKDDPMAATHTSHFTKKKANRGSTKDEGDEAPARVKESPEEMLERKNAEAEAARQKLKDQKKGKPVPPPPAKKDD